MSAPVAVVTGAAAGIGLSTADLFVERGYRVVFADRDAEGAARAADVAGSSALAVTADVGDPDSVEAMLATALHAFGRVDVLVNNAGVPASAESATLDDETWRRELDVNLTGAMRCSRAAFPALAEVGGAVVMMSSVAGLVGMAGRLSYSAAKAGLIAMTRVLAVEWAPRGIRVNAVAPGYVRTSGFEQRMVGPRAHIADELSADVPLGRLCRPDEIAAAVFFLGSADASYVTGQCLVVDGGLSVATRS